MIMCTTIVVTTKTKAAKKNSDDEGTSKQHDAGNDGDGIAARIELTQSFDRKRLEIRKRNRRAIFAAMHLGDIAGKLVLEKSKSTSHL